MLGAETFKELVEQGRQARADGKTANDNPFDMIRDYMWHQAWEQGFNEKAAA